MSLHKKFALFGSLLLVGCANTISGSDSQNSENTDEHPAYRGFDGDSDHPDWECQVNFDCSPNNDAFCYEHHCYKNSVFVITQTTLPPAQAENYYDVQLEAFNGQVPYEWIIAGALPEGLSYDLVGHITGTPTLASIGDYPLRVTVFDKDGKQASALYNLQVTEPDIYIATTEMPQGQLETEYTAKLEAAYGTEPFQWRLVDGELPPGLTLNTDGTIAGVPTAAGTFSFTVKVYDNGEPVCTATRHLELYIEPQPLTIKAGLYSFDLGSIKEELGGYSVTVLAPMVSGYSLGTTVLGATGGVPPYTWEQTENIYIGLALSLLGFKLGLPQGMLLDPSGAINGSATEAPSSFTIPNTEFSLEGYLFMGSVTDTEGSKATGLFLIPVIDVENIWDLLKGIKLF